MVIEIYLNIKDPGVQLESRGVNGVCAVASYIRNKKPTTHGPRCYETFLPIKIITEHRAGTNDTWHFPAFSGFGF
jgi:hypothetical protein